MGEYTKLALTALMPAAATALICLCDKKSLTKKLPYAVRQILIGLLFGGLAVIGTEFGVPVRGVMMNSRDGAVLAAGLLFGAPAGIIAGLVGGIERWVAVAWGVGSFTRVACSLSTILAGLYAALLRKYMFDEKRPGFLISLAIGVVMEVFHLTMVFLTNMDTPIEAMNVVRACTVPMILSNSLSVMLSTLISALPDGSSLRFRKREQRAISQTVQLWMLLAVIAAFVATSAFVLRLQNTIADSQADSLLELAIDEVSADIRDASDQNMLELTRRIAAETSLSDLETLAVRYDVAEINVVDASGIIRASTEPEFIGFDMSIGDQSAEFMCLLTDRTEFVQNYGPTSYDGSVLRKYAGIRTEDGFLQVGYDAKNFQKDIDTAIVGITKNRRVGQNGYILILDEKLSVVSGPDSFSSSVGADTGSTVVGEGATFRVSLAGEELRGRFRRSEGYYIVSLLPETEAVQMRNIAIYINTFMEILVFAILFGLIYMLIRRVVVSRIDRVNASLSRITGGDLDVVVDVRSNAEFASLSDDINSTVGTLKNYIAEASARIDKELKLAKDIQSSALPSTFPAFPKRRDFDIYACMDPAREVGGDFYDFYLTGSDTLNFLVADVSGKGIPASLFMMRAKTELKTLTEADLSLGEVFTRGNNALCEGNDAGMFVTAWQGSIDLASGTLTYANAGHNPPLVRRAGGKFEYLRSRPGFVLAGMEDVRYRTAQLTLEPGDVVFLYTDGVTEATDADSRLFGEERLLEAINSREFGSVREICETIRARIDDFVGSAPQFDDITMVAFRYFGTPAAPSLHCERARIGDIPAVTGMAEAELNRIGCPEKTAALIDIAIDEVFSNIVKYAYPDAPGPVTARIRTVPEERTVTLTFTDGGIPYNPVIKEDPDTGANEDEQSTGGLGVFMIRKTMDDVRYEYRDGQNILILTKKY